MVDVWTFRAEGAVLGTRKFPGDTYQIVRRLLAYRLNVEPQSLEFERDALGKPRLRCSIGPRVHFNLSHSGDFAALAVCPQGPVGVDIERWSRLRDPLALHRHISNDDDPPTRYPADHIEAQQFAAECWTRKEAVLKAIGTGLRLPMRRVSLRPLAAYTWAWTVDASANGFVADVPAPHGYVAALAWLGCPVPAQGDAISSACR